MGCIIGCSLCITDSMLEGIQCLLVLMEFIKNKEGVLISLKVECDTGNVNPIIMIELLQVSSHILGVHLLGKSQEIEKRERRREGRGKKEEEKKEEGRRKKQRALPCPFFLFLIFLFIIIHSRMNGCRRKRKIHRVERK